MTVAGRRPRGVAALVWGLAGVFLFAVGLSVAFNRPSRTPESLPDDVPLLLGEATKANFSHDIVRERAVLQRAEQLDGSPEDLGDVQRRLAVLDWKYYGRLDTARARLIRATQAAEPSKAWLALARMEQARRRFDAARNAARKARKFADAELERQQALIALAMASVGEATSLRFDGKQAVSDALRESFEELRQTVGSDPGHLEPSRLLLRAALLLDDGPSALVAWRSYFQVTRDRPGPNLVAGAGQQLGRLLSGWMGIQATPAARVELVRALAASRMFTEAALIALASSSSSGEPREDPLVAAVIGYARFLRDVRALTLEYYRRTIIGDDARDDWQASLSESVQPLMVLLDEATLETLPQGSTPPVDPRRVGGLGKRVIGALNERFGAYVSIGQTAGYFDLHMGHRVQDETRTVDQYGHRAELRFVAIDNMVSNGFQSWAWENGAQHGGWNKPYGIYQVRPAYVGGSLRAWRRLHSDEELREHLEEMDGESALDEERAASDPHAYLPGLAMRLRYQGQTRLLERLRSGGLDGEALRLAFIAAYDQAVLESSIFAHEGRHAIDKREGGMLQFMRNSEFTAKLAEVAFAPEPRLALGGIVGANIGDGTPHGKANLAIMEGVVEWMRRHANEIAALDAERALLPQLDLLTDEQLRAAFRSMDRLAHEG